MIKLMTYVLDCVKITNYLKNNKTVESFYIYTYIHIHIYTRFTHAGNYTLLIFIYF